jgi:hypothetical protein
MPRDNVTAVPLRRRRPARNGGYAIKIRDLRFKYGAPEVFAAQCSCGWTGGERAGSTVNEQRSWTGHGTENRSNHPDASACPRCRTYEPSRRLMSRPLGRLGLAESPRLAGGPDGSSLTVSGQTRAASSKPPLRTLRRRRPLTITACSSIGSGVKLVAKVGTARVVAAGLAGMGGMLALTLHTGHGVLADRPLVRRVSRSRWAGSWRPPPRRSWGPCRPRSPASPRR